MQPSPNFLPPLHPPGRSKTVSAWSALAALLLLAAFIIFQPIILRSSVRGILWIARPLTGLTIQSQKLRAAWGKPLQWQNVVITTGISPHQSKLELEELEIKLAPLWKILFTGSPVIQELKASEGKGLIDLRSQEFAFAFQNTSSLAKSSSHVLPAKIGWLPSSIYLKQITLLIMGENQRYQIENLSCSLPNKNIGTLSYEEATIEAGRIQCHLPQGKCDTSWDGTALAISNLLLAEDVLLRNLKFLFYPKAIAFGFSLEVFHGILRADGCFNDLQSGLFCDAAFLGEKLPMDRLSKFLGLSTKISGLLREGRLTFHGSPLDIMNAEASLRMSADNFRWAKKGWASLSIAANFIGHKISITQFQLKQHDNRVTASGEITLTEAWQKIAQAPFSLQLKAVISDASQLVDLIGPPWNKITGKLFIESEVSGITNHAQGYLHAQGSAMTGYGLPLDSLQLEMLFQGDKTDISKLEVWSDTDHLQLSGTIKNSWPHDYDAKGMLQLRNVSERLSQLSIDTTYGIQNGTLLAHWNGSGTATEHRGSFDFALKQFLRKNLPFSLQGNGWYTPNELSIPWLHLTQPSSTLTTKLLFSPHGIAIDDLTCLNQGNKSLSGAIFLPFHAMKLFQGKSFAQALLPDPSLKIALNWHRFPLQTFAFLFPSSWYLSGESEGKIETTGSWSAPSINLDLRGKDVKLANSSPSQAADTANSKIISMPISSGINNPLGHGPLTEPRSPEISGNSKTNPEAASSKTPFFSSLQVMIHTEKGTGSLNASIFPYKEKPITLQGSLPLALKLDESNTPLSFMPMNGPLNLRLSLPSFSIDPWQTVLLPPPIQIIHGILGGNLSIQGTLHQPEITGSLGLQADELRIGNFLHPLNAFQAKLLFAQDTIRVTENSALMGEGKITGSGAIDLHCWENPHYNLQWIGEHLLFYQSSKARFMGNVTLSLQGDQTAGTLHGAIHLIENDWNPALRVIPFLTPPELSMFKETSSLLASTPITSTWTTDLTITTQDPSPNPLQPRKKVPQIPSIKNIDLHLTGTLIEPVPEGKIVFNNLILSFPAMTMNTLEGGITFSSNQPWQPQLNLTASGISDGKQIKATFIEKENTKNLILSTPLNTSSEALGISLFLASESPTHSFFDNEKASATHAEGWMTQLPYWVRHQQIQEPVPSWGPFISSPSLSKNLDDLGFTSQGISYQVLSVGQ